MARAKTKHARTAGPIHAALLSTAMRQHGISDERLSIASKVSSRTISAVRLGRTKTIRPLTADALAAGLSSITGASYTGAWLRGEVSR
jgi:hypothetical protein